MACLLYNVGERKTRNLSDEVIIYCAKETYAYPAYSPNDTLDLLLSKFGKKGFMHHQAQGFSSYLPYNSYDREEEPFKKTVALVPRASLPDSANVIGSNTFSKMKLNGHRTLSLKARIAPHGQESDQRCDLRPGGTLCSPVGTRVMPSSDS